MFKPIKKTDVMKVIAMNPGVAQHQKIQELIQKYGSKPIFKIMANVAKENKKNKKINPNTGMWVKKTDKNNKINQLRSVLQNPKIPNIVKRYAVNNTMKTVGINRTLKNVRTYIKRMPTLRNHKGKRVLNNRLKKIYTIRRELARITGGEVTLGTMTKTLGSGVSGLAVTCISQDRCQRKWQHAILKVSEADTEWENDVKYHKKIQKYMDAHPNEDPLAPQFYGSFDDGSNRGYILMQNANYVFPKAVNIYLWENTPGGIQGRLKLLPNVEEAMQRLHKAGFLHGDMHSKNVYIAEFGKTRKTYKVFFIDFGRTSNYNTRNNLNKSHRTWRYKNMMNMDILLRKHPNIEQEIMNNHMVLEEYKKRATKK